MGDNDWDLIIDAEDKSGRSSLQMIWQYRDLLLLFVRRDFIAFYKQTILGPVWFFIRPIVATAVYFFIFGEVANLSTDGLPPVLFYLSGLMLWGFFNDTVSNCSNVLIVNAPMFGKVYFPRLVVPISVVISALLRLGVQLLLLFVVFGFYFFTTDDYSLRQSLLLIPFVILVVSMQAVGLGLFVAALATKYRDFSMLLGYLLQLGMFLAPVVFPLSSISGKFKIIVSLNPMTFPIELFRFIFFGTGEFSISNIIYMIAITGLIFLFGVTAFNKYEKSFVDTI